MRKILAALLLMAAPAHASDLPSGQPLALWQISWERIDASRELRLVIRAITPEVGARGFDVARADMDWICTNHGLTVAGLPHGNAAKVLVNMMDRPIARGTTNPDVTQFFGTYLIDDGACIWEDL